MLLVISFVVFMLLGLPLFGVIGLASIISMIGMPFPMEFIPQNLYTGMDQFPLIATIGFVMAGFLMEPAGITGEIIEVAKKAVGNIRGGLAMVTILACMIFAALSGSGPATTAAIGSIMIPGMIAAGYRKDDAAAVSATGGTLGILIPPSNPMIIYGVVANTSIAGLFMAGFIPGFVLTSLMCITAYCIAKKRGYQGTNEKFSIVGLCKAIWDGKWALATPAIILGGIYWGVFTPTEAAEVGVLWTLFVSLFVYRKLTWALFPRRLSVPRPLPVPPPSLSAFRWRLSRGCSPLYHIHPRPWARSSVPSPGPTIRPAAHRVLHLPVRLRGRHAGDGRECSRRCSCPSRTPSASQIQLGILFVVCCCETGFLTPPLGANLFITMKITDVKQGSGVEGFISWRCGCSSSLSRLARTSSCSCRGS